MVYFLLLPARRREEKLFSLSLLSLRPPSKGYVYIYIRIYKHTHTHSLCAIKASYKQLSARPLKGYLSVFSLSFSHTPRGVYVLYISPAEEERRRKCFGFSGARPGPERWGETLIFFRECISTERTGGNFFKPKKNKIEIKRVFFFFFFFNFGCVRALLFLFYLFFPLFDLPKPLKRVRKELGGNKRKC